MARKGRPPEHALDHLLAAAGSDSTVRVSLVTGPTPRTFEGVVEQQEWPDTEAPLLVVRADDGTLLDDPHGGPLEDLHGKRVRITVEVLGD